MELNFTIRINLNGEQLNLLYYIDSDLQTLSLSERQDVFEESFFSMQTSTVRTVDGTGRRSCESWDTVDFMFGNNTLTFTRENFDVETQTVSRGEFIETQYQLLIA